MKQKLNCILLIDDDEAINFLHKRIIQYADCATHVQVALNGEEALAYLQSAAEQAPFPELIFLDINMPKMNGWEFLEAYKALPLVEKQKPVLLLLTTSTNPDDIAKATNYTDVKEYLTKPMMGDKLNIVLAKYFSEYV